MSNIIEITEKLKMVALNCGATIQELKQAINQLEREQVTSRKGGRPLGVGNKETHLTQHTDTIRQRLATKDRRMDIAESLGVSRQTLNEFIRVNLPEYHKPK